MKYTIKSTKQFRKDYESIVKRGKDTKELEIVLEYLAEGKSLPEKYKDHPLRPSKLFMDCRELHIEPDWLLVYKYSNENLILYLIRTGSHNDLFK